MKDSKFWQSFTEHRVGKNKQILGAIIANDYEFFKKEGGLKKYLKYMIVYTAIILLTIVVSLSMLIFSDEEQQKSSVFFSVIEIMVFLILLTDLSLRWFTSDARIKKGKLSFLLFPFSFTNFILILSLLPSLYLINIWSGKNINFFEQMQAFKFFRIFRIILLANIIPSLDIFRRVIIKEKNTLYVVFGVVLLTIIFFAMVIYNVETSKIAIEKVGGNKANLKIHNFLDALYFATVSLTTIGFGDISPVTNIGKIVVMIMSIFGIAILATPAGIITGGFIQEIREMRREKEAKKIE